MKTAAMPHIGTRSSSDSVSLARYRPSHFWPWARAHWRRLLRLGLRQPRRLRLCESLPLGERRFVAVVEFESSRFLVGGTSTSLVLLSRLADGPAETPVSSGGNEEDR